MSTYDSIMLDLETMSTKNNASIVSIGMFKFDRTMIQRHEDIRHEQKLHLAVDLSSSQKYGLHIDVRTVLWWMEQPDEARANLANGMDIKAALEKVTTFVDNQEYLLWGHGSTFDNVILRNAYDAVGLPHPLPYRADICYRTIRRLFSKGKEEFTRYGTHHNALDDAISQALALQKMLAKVKER